MRKRERIRIYGPYRDGKRWKVIKRRADGTSVPERFTTEKAAKQFATECRRQLDALGIDEAIGRFQLYLEQLGLKQVSVYTSVRRLRTLAGDHGARPLAWLTPSKAQLLYDEMRDRGYSADYHRNTLAAAKRFGAWCVEQSLARHNAFESVKPIGKKRRGKPQLTIDESRKLYAHLLDDESIDATAVLLLLLLGLRASEVTGIASRDVDDGGRLLHVRKSKTAAGLRPLEIPDVLRPRLLELAVGGPIFGDRDRQWVYRVCRAACRAAGVPVVSPHGLRGTHATLATEAGATGSLVQRQLGHTSTETARRHYTAQGAAESAHGRAALRVLDGGRRG